MVQAVTTREMRKNFKKYADDVSNYKDNVIVTRPNGHNVVLISEEEYRSWNETNYLLATDANKQALDESIKQLDDGDSKLLSPEEFAELNND